MANKPQIIRAEPIPEDMLAILQCEGQEGWGVHDYPNRIARDFRRSKLASALGQLARIVEPVDRLLGVDQSMSIAKAFRAGSMIGLRVAAACVEDVDRAFFDIALVPTPERADDDDNMHRRQLFADYIVDMGDKGYAWVDGMFDPLLEDWEDLLVPEVRNQGFLRSGFGIPMAYLSERYRLNHEADRAADLADMAAKLETFEAENYDWDALLA